MSDNTELTIDQKIAVARIAAGVVTPAILKGKLSADLTDFSLEFDRVFTHIYLRITGDQILPETDFN